MYQNKNFIKKTCVVLTKNITAVALVRYEARHARLEKQIEY